MSSHCRHQQQQLPPAAAARVCPEKDSDGDGNYLCGAIISHGRQKFCHYHQHKCYGVGTDGQLCKTTSVAGNNLCFRCHTIFQEDSKYLAALENMVETNTYSTTTNTEKKYASFEQSSF